MFVFLIIIAVIILLFLFLIFPSFNKPRDINELNGKFIAHRGYHNLDLSAPENSLKAFALAVESGYIIENDIRLTKDKQVVVFHDETLLRLCGEDKKVSDLTLEELKKYHLAGTTEKIPTLKECLELVKGKVPLLIEFKLGNYSAKELFERADEVLKDYNGKYYVQSFFPQVIYYYRKRRPDICRGQLSAPYYNGTLVQKLHGCLLANFISRPHFVAYEHKGAGNIFFKVAKLLGAYPLCWTLKSQQELDKAKKHFKAYIFEGFKPKERKDHNEVID